MQRIFQITAWLLTLAIVTLSLVPAPARPTTIAGSGLEHFLIFLAVGVAFGFGHPRKPGLVALALLIFAACLEIAQASVPGRHARLSDFVVDGMASVLGVGLSSLYRNLSRQLFRNARDT